MRILIALILFSACTKKNELKETSYSNDSATTNSFFISNTGSGYNSGQSPDQPWSLEQANNYDFKPGSTINIIGTLYGSLFLSESGTKDARITIQGGSIFSNEQHGIYLYNNNNIHIRNIVVKGGGNMNINNAGIMLWSDDGQRHGNILIEKVRATGYGYAGIAAGLGMSPDVQWISEDASISYPGGYDDLLISKCITDSNGFAGIDINGSWPGRQNKNVVIKNSIASYNRGIKGRQPHSGHGIVMSGVSSGLIDSCEASYNGWEYGNANIGIWTYSSEDITIQNSVSFRNKSTTGLDGGGFDLDGGTWNCIMQFNLSYENDGAGYLVYEFGDPFGIKNNTVRYNISANDARLGKSYGGITIGGKAPLFDIHIHNNTIVQDKGAAITKIGWNVQGILEIKNNILLSPELPYLWGDAANNTLSNASLDENYKPLSESVVIDKGIELASLPKRDFYGNPINGIRDIGAIEY